MLSIKTKIEVACSIAGITQNELAKKMNTSPSAFNQRLKTGKFSDTELQLIAEILGCNYYSGFIFPDGQKIE